MYIPSDADWIREERRREVYQASEARWAMEGAIVPSSNTSGRWLDKLKTLLTSLMQSKSNFEPPITSHPDDLLIIEERLA